MAQQFANQQPAGFQNHVKNVAIIGAGGNVGSHIAKCLIAQGKHRVTALSRVDSETPLPDGIHAVKRVSYDDHAGLVAALQGEDVLIITLAAMFGPDLQKRIIDAAAAAGVRYIMPNEYGADYSNDSLAKEAIIGEGARAIRAYIEASTGPGGDPARRPRWLALSCSFWYEFSLAGGEIRFGFDFDRKTLTLIDDGRTAICVSTWPQCGRAVAALLALPILPADAAAAAATSPTLSSFADGAAYINSFVVSQRDMLASVLRVTGDTEADWTITTEAHRPRYERGQKMMQAGDMMGFGMILYTRVLYPRGGGDFSDKVVNAALGLPQEDLDAATKEAIRMHETDALRLYGGIRTK